MRIVNQPEVDTEYLNRLAEEYKKTKQAEEDIAKRTSALKKELSDAVEKFGRADDKGHMWLEVGDYKLKRERRVNRSFDSKTAEEWAKENNYWDDLKEVIEVLSEDKVLGLAWSKPELADTIQGFYIEKEIWAFKV